MKTVGVGTGLDGLWALKGAYRPAVCGRYSGRGTQLKQTCAAQESCIDENNTFQLTGIDENNTFQLNFFI